MGLIDRLIRNARSENGTPTKAPAKKAPARKKGGGGAATIELALSKRNAKPVLRTLEDVGYQLTGRAAMIESGAAEGTPSEARELRAQAKHIETMRAALAFAL